MYFSVDSRNLAKINVNFRFALTDSDDGSADGDDREAGEPLGDLARAHVLRPHLHVGLEHVVQHLRIEARVYSRDWLSTLFMDSRLGKLW